MQSLKSPLRPGTGAEALAEGPLALQPQTRRGKKPSACPFRARGGSLGWVILPVKCALSQACATVTAEQLRECRTQRTQSRLTPRWSTRP